MRFPMTHALASDIDAFFLRLTVGCRIHMNPNPLSGGDPRNRLFNAGPRIFRGIAASAAEDVRELFDRQIVRELVERGCLPATSISDQVIPGYALVLEHERIDRVTYAHEWTFGMLRDAAVFVLELREFLGTRGYELCDAHCDNVTFHRGRPIWLDFGSLIRNPNPRVWAAERRFYQSFIYPLQLWSRLGEFAGRRVLLGGDYMPREAALLGSSWWARRLSPAGLRRWCALCDNYAAIPGAPLPVLREKLSRVAPWRVFARVLPGPAESFLQAATQGRLPGHRHDGAALTRRLKAIPKRGYSTRWADYHTGVLQEVSAFETYPRFRRVLAILQGLQPASVTEIGTNQGALATLILQQVKPSEMVCLDIDDGALECYYHRNRETGETRVTHAVLDVMRPFNTMPKLSPGERFKSEALVALAVTHHMVMGQCNSLDYLFTRLASFTSRWILVEYMPHGFHTEPMDFPPPENYSAANFDAAFRHRFEVVQIETLEPTRVLYVGRLLGDATGPERDGDFLR